MKGFKMQQRIFIDEGYTDEFVSGETVLKCANCGDEYTHQKTIEVYEREEDEQALHTTITRQGTYIDREDIHNPSSRRESVILRFQCEDIECQSITVLRFVQHKGCTFITIDIEE